MSKPTRRTITLGLAATMAGLAAPVLGSGLTQVDGAAFGTYWRVLVPGQTAARQVRAHADRLLPAIDAALSPWNPKAELARFNASPLSTVPVSRRLALVTHAALNYARATGGAFDPTVGPIVGRRGFGPIRQGAAPDWLGITVKGTLLKRTTPSLTLDLCGIAKGHAIDALAEALDKDGLTDWLIDMGGELRARGRNPLGRDWKAAIARPFSTDGTAVTVLSPGDMALATSGVAEQSYELNGSRISHLVGSSSSSEVLSASVLASTAMKADALATALAVMPPSTALGFARKTGLPVLLVIETPDGQSIRQTPAFARYRLPFRKENL